MLRSYAPSLSAVRHYVPTSLTTLSRAYCVRLHLYTRIHRGSRIDRVNALGCVRMLTRCRMTIRCQYSATVYIYTLISVVH